MKVVKIKHVCEYCGRVVSLPHIAIHLKSQICQNAKAKLYEQNNDNNNEQNNDNNNDNIVDFQKCD